MLGHNVSRKGVEVDKVKVNLISNMPVPTSAKQVKSFRGSRLMLSSLNTCSFKRKSKDDKSKKVLLSEQVAQF